jgi:hypothetical protein
MDVKVLVVPKPEIEEESWYKATQLASRLLMSVRKLSVSYQQNDNFTLPGFKPENGLIFETLDYGRAPGWDFASGFFTADDYINKVVNKDWVVMSDSVVSPAVITRTSTLRIKSSLLPIAGLKIELSAQRTKNENRQVQYMISHMPETNTGSFSMSTIALKTALAPVNAKKSYYSKAFETFVENRDVIANRLEAKYARTSYPNSGFLSGSSLSGQSYDQSNGSVDKNSADVLIPAFLAAYTGTSVDKTGLRIVSGTEPLIAQLEHLL